MDKLLIIGCGGHARSVCDVLISLGVSNIFFWDQHAKKNEMLFSFPVTNDVSVFDSVEKVFFAVGGNEERARYFNKLYDKDIVRVVSENTYISPTSLLGRGVFVAHGAHIGPMVTIGDNTIINTHAVIEHECLIGAHSHISVNATIAGRCTIGDFVFIGAGSTIKDKINICSDVVVGAGSTVVKDIVEPGTYVGSPVCKIK